MTDTGFSTSDAVLTAAMSGNGFGNRGGMGDWGGNSGYGIGNAVLAAEAHANGTAVKEALDCNSLRFSDGLNDLRSQFDNQTRTSQFEAITKSLSDSEFRGADRFVSISKNVADAEFRSLDRQRDIERHLVDNAKDAAKCCCETQKLITAEATATRALILEVEGRSTVAALAQAQAKITQLETINALSRVNGHD